MSDLVAEEMNRIMRLQAENERLREALERATYVLRRGDLTVAQQADQAQGILDAALNPEEEK